MEKYSKKSKEETEKIRKKLGLPLDKTILIYTGQVIPRKNQKEAIEAVLNCDNKSNLILLICGKGNDLQPLREEYKEEKNIIFTGEIDNVTDYLKASDIFVSTSKSEGMPNSVLEAMSTGLPVLLSDIPQHKEILEINSNCGFLYTLGTMKDLSAKIDNIMKMDLEKMGNESYDTVKANLTSEIMSEHYQELYKKILNGGDSNVR